MLAPIHVQILVIALAPHPICPDSSVTLLNGHAVIRSIPQRRRL